jgi:hypothetical protein
VLSCEDEGIVPKNAEEHTMPETPPLMKMQPQTWEEISTP